MGSPRAARETTYYGSIRSNAYLDDQASVRLCLDGELTPLMDDVHSQQTEMRVKLVNEPRLPLPGGPGDHGRALRRFLRVDQADLNTVDELHGFTADTAALPFLDGGVGVIMPEEGWLAGRETSFVRAGIQQHGKQERPASQQVLDADNNPRRARNPGVGESHKLA